MRKKLDGMTKEDIIETAIRLIDSKGGASNVNLREIARTVGCSAPNIYNYFINMDDLLNTVLIRICDDFKTNIQEKTKEINNDEDFLKVVFRAYIEYAVENSGRLNIYHFEKLNFTISTEAEASARSVGEHMASLLFTGLNQRLPYDKVTTINGILHCYIIGALSNYITGRISIDDKEHFIKEMVDTSKRIFNSLVQSF